MDIRKLLSTMDDAVDALLVASKHLHDISKECKRPKLHGTSATAYRLGNLVGHNIAGSISQQRDELAANMDDPDEMNYIDEDFPAVVRDEMYHEVKNQLR